MHSDIQEKDPSLKTSSEDQQWSLGEYTAADVNDLYGFSTPTHEDTVAVEDLDPQIDQHRVAEGVDGDTHLGRLGDVRVNERGLYQDANEVQSGANSILGELGMANKPETTVTLKEAANETVAETLVEGQDEESGRLGYEARRDARNVTIATEIDKALRRGDTTPLEFLPVSVASKVAEWLGDVGQRYGGAEFAPNDEVGTIGEYISFSEKVSSDTDGETIVHSNGVGGEVVVESTADVVMRVLEGDPEATKLLNPDDYQKIVDLHDDLVAQSGNFFSSKLDEEDKELLISRVRKALLRADAERSAS